MQTSSSIVRSCKVFAAEQMIRELIQNKSEKKKVKKKKKIKPNKPILKATNNLKISKQQNTALLLEK